MAQYPLGTERVGRYPVNCSAGWVLYHSHDSVCLSSHFSIASHNDLSMMLLIERECLTVSAKSPAESQLNARRPLDSSMSWISVAFLLYGGGAIGVLNKSVTVSVSEENMMVRLRVYILT